MKNKIIISLAVFSIFIFICLGILATGCVNDNENYLVTEIVSYTESLIAKTPLITIFPPPPIEPSESPHMSI